MGAEQLLAADRFAAALGVRLVEADRERVVVEMDVDNHHRDSSGRISAGALFSLADCAMSLISNLETTAVAVATHFTSLGEDLVGSTIRAEARADLPTEDSRMTTWTVTLLEQARVVASFTGTTLQLD